MLQLPLENGEVQIPEQALVDGVVLEGDVMAVLERVGVEVVRMSRACHEGVAKLVGGALVSHRGQGGLALLGLIPLENCLGVGHDALLAGLGGFLLHVGSYVLVLVLVLGILGGVGGGCAPVDLLLEVEVLLRHVLDVV